MKPIIAIGLIACCLAATVVAANEPAIIPLPQNIERKEGAFKLTPDLVIATDAASKDTGKFLAELLRPATGYKINTISGKKPDQKPPGSVIVLTTESARANLGAEGYELEVTPGGVTISAPEQAGLFYGAQTLLQLLPPEIFSATAVKGFNWEIPCVKISDAPRFPWRGLMLDVSRHFFTTAEVKQILDVMALHKLNTFHWHLVDDHGWRMEIKKYPKLTSVAAWRPSVGFGLPTNSTTAYGPDGRYGGFYTQEDIREVVAYAQKLHITVVPEIEMPGHSLAALSAYPEFGSGPGPFVIPHQGGVMRGIYSPAKPETFKYLQNVLTEVFELFPGKYIHIGGDEVPKGSWTNDVADVALMKREGLKSKEELQNWFTRRIEKFLSGHGRTLIGWSEIRHGGLPGNAVLMDWIGGSREAASAGHDVVMSPTTHCYFDGPQSRDKNSEPKASGAFVSLKKVYSFEPVRPGLAPEFEKHILGAQGNVWTEMIPNAKHAEYMTFPRAFAIAEVTWSPKESRDYDGFLLRLKSDERRLDQLGVKYRNSALGDGTEAQSQGGTAQLSPATIATPVMTLGVIRIDAGNSSPFTDSSGNTWQAGLGFIGGEVSERDSALKIANTKDPGLFLTEHYAMDSFECKVPDGKYVAKLYFAETYDGITGPGERVFSFNVQGREFKDFDVWVKAGGPNRAYVETVPVEVTNGTFKITFTANVDNPQINAIELARQK